MVEHAFLRKSVSVGLSIYLSISCGDSGDPTDPFNPNDAAPGTIIAGHETIAAFNSIPSDVFQNVRDNYRFYYGHTSHGSQIITGINMLANVSGDYASPSFHEVSDDLGQSGDVSWAAATRSYLDGHPGEIDVVMWSWCGGVSDNTEDGIQIYLDAVTQLELDYPDVLFIYMTGHLDGTGDTGNLRARNNQIRSFAAANGKILFDFADIESYDPDGNYYPDGADDCAWCADWCSTQDCPACGSCAHSHCFNCYQKGKAFWAMMARVSGWEPTS